MFERVISTLDFYSLLLAFVINSVPLRIQSSVPIFTQECDYWLDCSLPFWHSLSPPGHLLPPSSLLYLTLWISLGVLGCGEHLGNWSQARLVSLLWLPLLQSWSPLSPSSLFFSLYNSVNISEQSRWLLASFLSPLLIPPHLIRVTSNYPLPLLFSM